MTDLRPDDDRPAAMKLYVCYGTWTVGKPVHAHPCGEARQALAAAGHTPEVVRSYGLGPLPAAINNAFAGRREVMELTGRYWVPALVLDDGTAISGSRRIIDWAREHPVASVTTPAPGA